MSSVPNNFGLGYWGGYASGFGALQWPIEVETTPRDKQPPKGEQTDRSQTWYGSGYAGMFAGMPFSPWYTDIPAAGIATYRLMEMTCPTLVLVEAAVFAPILAAGPPTCEIRNKDGTTRAPVGPGPLQEGQQRDELDQRAELIHRMFGPLWPDLIHDSLRAVKLGHQPFEVVWDVREGTNWITDFAAFRPEDTQLVIDKRTKKFIGIRPYGKEENELVGPQALNIYYDAEARNWYGRSRRENIRHEWWRLLKDDKVGSQLDDKAKGIVVFVEGHLGASGKDANGQPMNGQQIGKVITDGISTGRSVFVPSYAFKPEDIEKNPELANIPAFRLQHIDLGQTGPASEAILKKMELREKRIVRGYCRPEREVLEASRGGIGQGDSHTQGQVGILDSELVQAGIYLQINRGPVNNVLTLKYGADAADSVYWKPAPLSDPTVSFLQEVVKTALADTAIGPQFASLLNKADLMHRTELPTETDPDKIQANLDAIQKPAQDALKAQADAKAQQNQPPPGSNGQGKNGNGKQKVGGRIGQR